MTMCSTIFCLRINVPVEERLRSHVEGKEDDEGEGKPEDDAEILFFMPKMLEFMVGAHPPNQSTPD